MENRDKKPISDELVFQRKYYNSKNPNKKITLDRNHGNYNNDLCEMVGKQYTELTGEPLERTKSNYPKGFSFEVLDNIEKNNLVKDRYNQKKKEVQTLDNYYLIMFCMFKVYGFLDDYDIFMLLKKYGIRPKNEIMKKKVYKIKEKCIKNYKNNPYFNYINLEETSITIDKIIIDKLGFRDKRKVEFLGEYYFKERIHRKITINYKRCKDSILNRLEALSKEERQCFSLAIGKESDFIDDLINKKVEGITYKTLLRTLEHLGLKKSDLYYIIRLEIYLKENENMKIKNNEQRIINMLENI